MIRIIPLLLLFNFFEQFSYSQDSVLLVGGINRYAEIPPQQLENAHLRVWYEFNHPIKKDSKRQVMRDTMLLVAGNRYSVYYDWSRELKYKKMIGQLDFAKETTESIIYSSFDTFLEVALDDQRLSEFKMNRDNSEILKDRQQQILTTTDMNDTDLLKEDFYLLEEKMAPQVWQVHSDTMFFLGYNCQRATCNFRGRDYSAWFTTEIPLSDGPYKFYGLPGLILSVEDSDNQIQFRAIGIEQLTGVVIVTENKNNFIQCTPEQYKKVKKRMKETVVLYYSRGVSLFVTKRFLPAEYIPIELANE